jgi:hypothetical protein
MLAQKRTEKTNREVQMAIGKWNFEKENSMSRKLLAFALMTVLIAPLLEVQAESTDRTGFRGWGPRLGVTVDPDQIHFGGHIDLGNFAEHVRFQPNLELGFGDNITLVAANLEAVYRFSSNWDVWTPYLGGGLGVNFYSWNDGKGKAPGHGDSDNTELGVNAVGGIEKGLSSGDRFFLELKLGFADSPDFKVTVGWTFFH